MLNLTLNIPLLLAQAATQPGPTPTATQAVAASGGVSVSGGVAVSGGVPSAPASLNEAIRNFFDTLAGMFSKGDALAQPEHVIRHLQALGAVWAVVFVVVGVLCMFNGYRFYKIATVAVALLLGMFIGYWFGGKIGAPYIVAGCIGTLLATLAFPLMKYAVAALGGLTGAFIGANLWTGLADAVNTIASEGLPQPRSIMPAGEYWLGALLGLLICGMLAFILFKMSIVMFTAVSGSTLAMMGVLALLLSFEPWHDSVAEGLKASQLVIPLLVFVPALMAFIMQEVNSGGVRVGEGAPKK